MEDDQEYIDDLVSSSWWADGSYLRNVFVIMLESESLSDPLKVWEQTCELLSDDIERMKRDLWHRPDLILSDKDKKLYALQEIDKLLRCRGTSLAFYSCMPRIPEDDEDRSNALIADEKSYDREYLKVKNVEWVEKMTPQQKNIYDDILAAVNNEEGGIFFINGFGGTGKTLLWSTISANVRSKAHSRFGSDEFSTCTIVKGSDQANLIKKAKLIIWDEAPMMSKYCFESLDRSLNDICGRVEGKLFGGKTIVFGGDFRQILLVINGGTRTEVVMSSINSSYIWASCIVYNLTKNMRLLKNTLPPDESKDAKEFSEWILNIGDGKLVEPNDGEALIDIPEEFLITQKDDPI